MSSFPPRLPALSGPAFPSTAELIEALDRLVNESLSSDELVWDARERLTVIRQRYRVTSHEFTREQIVRLNAAAAVPDLVSELGDALDDAARLSFRDEVEALFRRFTELERALVPRRIAERAATGARQLRERYPTLPERSAATDAAGLERRAQWVEAHAEACSNCGSPMRLREGPYGYFLGCSAFPLCFGARRLTIEQAAVLEQPSSI